MTTKRKIIKRSKEEWLKIIDAWKISQKNIVDWCQENGIAASSFHSACSRLHHNRHSTFQKQLNIQSCSFHELKESNQTSNGIELSIKGVTLKLSQKFDEYALLHLLKILEKL